MTLFFEAIKSIIIDYNPLKIDYNDTIFRSNKIHYNQFNRL